MATDHGNTAQQLSADAADATAQSGAHSRDDVSLPIWRAHTGSEHLSFIRQSGLRVREIAGDLVGCWRNRLTLDTLKNRARYVAPITNRRVQLSGRRAHNGAWSQSSLLRSV